MPYEHILVENEDGVAVITMNRPEVLNAMNHTLTSELHDAVMAANADDNIGCIVITGTGDRAFSAGGDIHEQREDARNRTEEDRDVRSAEHSQWMYDISSSPKPVIVWFLPQHLDYRVASLQLLSQSNYLRVWWSPVFVVEHA